jgi:hypothetical protein
MRFKTITVFGLGLVISTTPAISEGLVWQEEDPWYSDAVPVLGFDFFDGRLFNGRPRVRVVDSFCSSYRRIVLTRRDLSEIRATSRPIRDRIQANDLNYLCRCEGFRSSLCNGLLR